MPEVGRLNGGKTSRSSQGEEMRECSGLAFEHLSALHASLTAEMTDTAALSFIVLNNPGLLRRYRLALAGEVRLAKPLVAIAMQAYRNEVMVP